MPLQHKKNRRLFYSLSKEFPVVPCPKCGKQFRQNHLDEHRREAHPDMATCSRCGKSIPKLRFYQHIQFHLLALEAKFTPERLGILMQRLKDKYGDNLKSGNYP
jgi:ribosomal protein L32